VETIGKIRHAYLRDGKLIRAIARDLRLSRNTVKNVLRWGGEVGSPSGTSFSVATALCHKPGGLHQPTGEEGVSQDCLNARQWCGWCDTGVTVMSTQIAADQDWLRPPHAKLSGHETFALRFAWLKKGLDQMALDAGVFHSEDAVVRLGVGKNMVRSIRHWCLSTRLAQEVPQTRGLQVAPTVLGERLLSDAGWDPYLEDDATLWLLHWQLASAGTRSFTWYWAFNRFREYIFDRAGILKSLKRELSTVGWTNLMDSTLKSDVDCLVHTYLARREEAANGEDPIECPLTTLGLLIKEPYTDGLRFQVGPKPTLPPAIYAYALAEFWNYLGPDRRILEFSEVMGAEGSPSIVFLLDWDSIVRYLDKLAVVTDGAMVFEEDYEIRRVVKRDEGELDSLAILEAYYDGR